MSNSKNDRECFVVNTVMWRSCRLARERRKFTSSDGAPLPALRTGSKDVQSRKDKRLCSSIASKETIS